MAVTVTKDPDQGAFWHPLSPNGGTYVYADSFVAPISGTVSSLGTWLTDQGSGGTDVRFQILGSLSGNVSLGPDVSNVLATTAVQSGLTGPLTFYSAATLGGSTPIVGGQTYWFAANVIGLSGPGDFQVGAHTQNSEGITDNGTFWYSNDPTGSVFDGKMLTPEMAFSVTVVPEPSAIVLAVLASLGLVAWVSRRRNDSCTPKGTARPNDPW
jgi:hypothetical protein